MRLVPGSKLDSYEVLDLLGAGGMGEVYRARDSVLKREVAIKVLPPYVSQNPDRLRRFEQEAQATAALNHPNILSIYQFGAFEGAPYLVSELLEGSNLREQLKRGPIPVRKAIEYGVQIARGLAAAHEKGIVHRDLKPENLFVLKDGRVKILDFGLAKLMQPQTESDGNATTLTHQTDPGLVMGTAGYMSPEQVRGQAIDHRADIFAFGAILYEMLAGRRPFQRATSVETMTAILNEDPPSISQIAQTTPPGMQRVVHRCLEKNPEQRFQSASDLAFALEAITESGSKSGFTLAAPRTARFRKSLAWSGAALALAALAAFAYWRAVRHSGAPFEHFSMVKATDSEHVRSAAISPDGTYLVTVVEDSTRAQSVILRQIPTNAERPLLKDPAFRGYGSPLFSPDGNYIYFRTFAVGDPSSQRRDLYRIPVLGGSPERVLQGIDAPPSFLQGGQRLCFYRELGETTFQFLSASADGVDERVLASGKNPFPTETACDPSGKFGLLEDELGHVESLDFASGARKPLISIAALGGYVTDLRWAPDARGVFAIIRREPSFVGQIVYITYPGGVLHQVTNDLSSYAGISLTADAKTIATRQTNTNPRFELLSLDGTARLEEHGPPGLRHFSWLDNNTIVAGDSMSVLRTVDVTQDEVTTLNAAKGHWFMEPYPCGPDTIVSVGGTLDKSQMHIYRMSRDGSLAAEVTAGPYDVFPACSPDGKWLYYADTHDQDRPQIMRLAMDAGKSSGSAPQATAPGARFKLSPDGTLLAVISEEGNAQLHIYSTSPIKKIQDVQLPRGFFHSIAISPDDKTLFYATMAGPDTTIWKRPLDDKNGADAPTTVVSLPGKTIQSLHLSPDGARLGMILESPQSEAVLLRENQ